jgi:ribosomal protein S18 acetylase RimI-like enzyme
MSGPAGRGSGPTEGGSGATGRGGGPTGRGSGPREIPRLSFRLPTEADHRALVDDIERWFLGRRMRPLFGRLWFVHFASTSRIAQTVDGHVAGILLGFASPDHPTDAVLHLAAVDPNLRRRGIGTAIHDTWLSEMALRGATRAIVAVPPDERVAILFYRSLGFEPEVAGTRLLWGVPAFEDYDADGADRALLVRRIAPAG